MQWPRLIVALVVTGVAGILNGSFGPIVRHWVNIADQAARHAVGSLTGAAVTGLVGILTFGFVAFRVFHNEIDMKTLAGAAALPATVTLIPGALGTIAVTLVGIIPWALTGLLTYAFGGH